MKYLIGEHPSGSTFYAAIDPSAHHVEGRIGQRKFHAFMSPFKTEQEAAIALLEAGAMLCGPGRPTDRSE